MYDKEPGKKTKVTDFCPGNLSIGKFGIGKFWYRKMSNSKRKTRKFLRKYTSRQKVGHENVIPKVQYGYRVSLSIQAQDTTSTVSTYRNKSGIFERNGTRF